ncbi:MAG: hypothetical protein ACJA1A_002048 [Saprospiraceae bacterium]|jgi:hypothetical protein|tara:strand:- start:558 stop:1442 length:885 start_codon:yes stop_codon:yes gene_type:complete
MRIIKNIRFLFIAALAFSIIGCVGDDFEGTIYPGNEFKVGGTTVSALNVSGDFDIGKVDVQSVTYTVNSLGEPISGVEVRITSPDGKTGTLGTSTTFPDVQTVSLADALAATGVALDDVEVADMWLVEYLVDGTPSSASFKINTVTTFKSALAGTMTAVTTATNQEAGIGWDGCTGVWEGSVEFRRQQLLPNDDGEYKIFTTVEGGEAIEDMSFGAYYPCYMADGTSVPLGDLRLMDIDNKLSFTGASQWGEVFSISNVSVTDGVLSFNWTNDYGEGAHVALTRTDGEVWPDLN